MRPARDLVLAADIGGTQMRAALVDGDGQILLRKSAPTPSEAEAVTVLIELIRSVGASDEGGRIGHAVVGLPGAVDYRAGKLLWAPNLPDAWPDLLSRDKLSAQLGLRTYVANDADLAAIGEATAHTGKRTTDMAYLTISTGIGAGVVLGGDLVSGNRSLAELGHTVIDWRAWRNGQAATLEELASGTGVARQAREAGLGDLDAAAVATAAGKGDPRATSIWLNAIAAGAAGVANMVMSFSPSLVVIGGGLGRREGFFQPLRQLVMRQRSQFPDDLDVVASTLGEDAALAGAAQWESMSGVVH
jgi:predicted NBD/HSP70 family sugar kinase